MLLESVQTHQISVNLNKSEVRKLKKMIKDEEMTTVVLVPQPGGHNSGEGDYYFIKGSEQELKDLCDYCSDSIGYFSESDIEKI